MVDNQGQRVRAASAAVGVVRHRVWQSVTVLQADGELRPYLEQTFIEVAHCYNKEASDFTISDVKRAVDAIHDVMKRLALEDISLSQFQSMANTARLAADILQLVSFSMAVAGLVSGQLRWLVWHISKNVGAPRVKRAAAVYLAGNIAVTLYGGETNEITFEPTGLDPVLDSMDRETLHLVASNLQIGGVEGASEQELVKAISKKLRNKGKDQHPLRAWFPRDARSYIEVLVAAAKAVDVDIRGLSSVEEIEGAICSFLFTNIWDRLTPEQRADLTKTLQHESKGMAAEYIASAAALGAIGAAQLSGFGVYMAASTALSFLSMSAGIVLPFTAYTSLSATIAVAIGPLGLALAAFPAVFKFLQTKPEQLLGGIVVIAAWRSRLIAEGRMVGSETANNQRSTNRRRRWKVALVGVLVAVLVGFAALLLRPR